MLKFSRRDDRLIIICGVLFLVFIGLFLYETYKKEGVGNRKIIGTITFKKNTVQRKLFDQVIWTNLEKNSPLAAKDTIRAFADADAVIKLNDGTEIAMDENSMFFLDTDGDTTLLDIKEGSMQLNKTKGSDFTVSSGDKKVNVQEGKMNLEASGKEGMKVFLESGKATVSGKSGSQEIQDGTYMQVNESGGMDAKSIRAVPTFPPNQKMFQTKSGKATIPLQWKIKDPSDVNKLQVSKSRSFKANQIDKVVTSNSEEVELGSGTYFWRIETKEKEGKISHSPTSKFIIFQEEPIVLYSPSNNDVIRYYEKIPLVSFRWSKSDIVSEYQLEISSRSDFSNLVENKKTVSTSLSLDSLSQGKYFWRVKYVPIDPSAKTLVSGTNQFSISKTDQALKPELSSPANDQTLSLVKWKSSPQIFIWKGLEDFTEYTFELSNSSSFSKILSSVNTKSNFIKISSPPGVGKYFWRVKGKTKSGSVVTSDSESFELTENGKKVEEPIEEKTVKKEDDKDKVSVEILSPTGVIDLPKEREIVFKWSSSKKKETFFITVFSEESGKRTRIYENKITGTEYVLRDFRNFKEGRFVFELTSNNKSISKASSNFILNAGGMNRLKSEDIQFISPKKLYKDR